MPNSIQFNPDLPDITVSNQLYERAKRVQKPVTQTLAKGPGQFSNGVAPKYLDRGQGCYVWDVDGNQYLDYNAAIGPVSLGYAYPAVDAAIRAQLERGISFSLMHPLEVELAELVQQVIPNAEAVRFGKTGAEVCSAAVRLARAFTGRERVLCCGYHGWHDWYIGTTTRHAGIPDPIRALTATFTYNDLGSVERQLDDTVAAVMLEPVIFEEAVPGFLEGLLSLCRANGTLLIFDEMWTGFRLALGGAQEYFGVVPDLAVYSKACANGMPLALLTGRAEVLELANHDVFCFSTFGGETLSLAAGVATINELRDHHVPAYLAEKGQVLKDGYNQLAAELGLADATNCIGYPCRTMVTFSPGAGDALELKTLMQQELIRRGILWAGFHTMTFAHTDDDIAYTLQAYREVLTILKEAIDSGNVRGYLRGEVLEVVFRKTISTPQPALR